MLVILLAISSIFAISADGFVTGNSGIAPQNLACPGSEIDEACSKFCGPVDTSGFIYAAYATSNSDHIFSCICQAPNIGKVEGETPSISGAFPIGVSVLPQITTSPSSQEELCQFGSPQLKTCEKFCPLFNQKPYCVNARNEEYPQNSYFACACYS